MIKINPEQVRGDLIPYSEIPVREHLTMDGKTKFITDGDYDGELASYYPWRLTNGYVATSLGSYYRHKKSGKDKSSNHGTWLYLQDLMTPTRPIVNNMPLSIRFINGNRLDCRSANLEFITSSNLAAARQIGSGDKGNGASGYVGVRDMATGKRGTQYLAHPTWKRYQVVAAGKSRKVYATAEEAARVYDELTLEKYGKYAQLNFPREHL